MIVRDRFLEHFIPEPNSGCWLWHGSTDHSGYGQFSVAGKLRPAHRVSYERDRGEIPQGLQLDHLCRIRSCVNPFHLEPVTQAENIRRGDAGKNLIAMQACKTHCPKGHPYDEMNTYIYRGERHCRACHREVEKVRRNRKKGGVL